MGKKQEEIKEVSGYPAKSFFVSMLTRDIELSDAILDLLDNCVDGAIRTRAKDKADEDSLEGFWARIKFDENRFVIEDNCGGIPWKPAKEYAFRMGRPEGASPRFPRLVSPRFDEVAFVPRNRQQCKPFALGGGI